MQAPANTGARPIHHHGDLLANGGLLPVLISLGRRESAIEPLVHPSSRSHGPAAKQTPGCVNVITLCVTALLLSRLIAARC